MVGCVETISRCKKEGLVCILGIISSWKGGHALEWASHGSGGVAIPEGSQAMSRFVTNGHHLVVELVVLVWWLDLMIFKGLFQPR